jgi:hypothetical protein
MMFGSAGLVFISSQLLLQGRSIFGRFWIIGVVFGLYLLVLGFLGWRKGQDEERDVATSRPQQASGTPSRGVFGRGMEQRVPHL